MAVAYITELRDIGFVDHGGMQVAQWPRVTKQTVAIGAEAKSAAFNTATRYIRVQVDAICSYDIATSPTATTTDARLPADAIEYMAVNAGDKISFISNT